MSSVRDSRQRAAARAKLEREMAARREAARRKRVMQARIGAATAGVIVLAAVVWIIVAATGDSQPTAAPTGPTTCTWYSEFPTPSPGDPSPSPLPSTIRDVGTPPTDPPRSGFQVLTFDTNLGQVQVEMDLSKTPCTAASLAYLAGKGFYDGTSCHRLVADIFALQCGDPTGTGTGGATYRFDDENLPANKKPAYHEGDVAMANTGQPGTNGTQFFFVYGNTQLQGNYSLWGRVISGMDIIKKVAAAGDDEAFAAEAGGGHPNQPFTFTKVTAGPVTLTPAPTPTPAASAGTSPSSSPSPTPSA